MAQRLAGILCLVAVSTAHQPSPQDDVALLQESLRVGSGETAQEPQHTLLAATTDVSGLDVEQEMWLDAEVQAEAWASSTYKAAASLLETHVQITGDSNKKSKLAVQLAIPAIALGIGLLLLMGTEVMKIFGKILVFFGAQTFMNLYMKAVLSNGVIDPERHLKGFPAAFAVTGIQQITSFSLFGVLFIGSQVTPYPYIPRKLTRAMEIGIVIVFAFTFTLNIALNNFSLALVPLSVNLIIRSCSPLTTYLAQVLLARLWGEARDQTKWVEIGLMLTGVVCAGIAVVAKSIGQRHPAEGDESRALFLGVICCIASLFSGAVNLALAGVLGKMSLNPLDTTLYMSIPAFIFLLFPAFLIPHPTDWPVAAMTDWQITKEVARLAPGTIGLAFLSGAFALTYNVLQYTLVQTLSATHAAFAGNFNKAATIGLAILFKLEKVPQGACGIVMLLAILGNILAFTAYNLMKAKEGKKAH